MTNSTTTTIDPSEKITIDCDEPNCRHFESGHEVEVGDLSPLHERAEFGEVTVSRGSRDALWDIEIYTRDVYTAAEAEKLVEALTAAIADTNALNASRV